MTARSSSLIDTRVIYCGDCLEQLQKLPDGCIDLIYIDPPFNSNRNYEVFWGESKEKRSFEDRHESTQAYIEYMRPRCVEMARVLKKTGSFYYHCDWHASHYVKVMLDQIFGENQFLNEIVWKRTSARKSVSQFGRVHDVILFYGAERGRAWNPLSVPQTADTAKGHDMMVGPDGEVVRYSDLSGGGQGPPRTFGERGEMAPPKGRHWMFDQEGIDRLMGEGRIAFSAGGRPRLLTKMSLDVNDVWTDIEPINAAAAERLGYPTQKPLALLERIVRASSNENDVVLDAFCGCGTALLAAEKLKRQWIGIDVSPTACRVMAKRLQDHTTLREDEKLWKAGRGFVVRDLPWTEAQLRKIPPFEFENWAVIALGGIPNKAQVGDMGIDGRIFPVSSMPKQRSGALSFMDEWFPIQVKQKDKVGRPDVDSFEAVMERENRKKGFFISFAFSQDAEREIDAYFRRSGRVIIPLTVREILDEHIAKKLA